MFDYDSITTIAYCAFCLCALIYLIVECNIKNKQIRYLMDENSFLQRELLRSEANQRKERE